MARPTSATVAQQETGAGCGSTTSATAPQPRQRTGARRTLGATTASPCTTRGGQVRRRSSGAGGS
ncbi:hypothetical protein U1Q18_039474, partial [Sarracenia purpurea var. burkii]